jgi:hypothetical protein
VEAVVLILQHSTHKIEEVIMQIIIQIGLEDQLAHIRANKN